MRILVRDWVTSNAKLEKIIHTTQKELNHVFKTDCTSWIIETLENCDYSDNEIENTTWLSLDSVLMGASSENMPSLYYTGEKHKTYYRLFKSLSFKDGNNCIEHAENYYHQNKIKPSISGLMEQALYFYYRDKIATLLNEIGEYYQAFYDFHIENLEV